MNPVLVVSMPSMAISTTGVVSMSVSKTSFSVPWAK